MPNKYTNKLNNKRILILGGTSGIGFTVAENCLEHGATIIVASSRQSSVDHTLTRLRSSYPDLASAATGHTIDLRSDNAESAHHRAPETSHQQRNRPPRPHRHNRRRQRPHPAPLPITGAETLTDAQRVRIVAPIFLAKHAPGTYMHVSNKSSITLTGGVNTYRPAANWTIPVVAVPRTGLVRSLAVDLRPIRVNLVEPGAIDTELFQRTFSGEQLEAFREKYRSRH